jgi:hypothetical protein
MATSQTSIPVPKILWDELENALMIKSKELIKDIAKVLRQDEKQLWQEFRSKKKSLHLFDAESSQEDYECTALVCTTPVAHRCRKPVLFGKHVCPEHEYSPHPSDLKSKPQLQRIQTSEKDDETIFVDPLTQQVYSVFYERKGYLQNNKCFVFEIEEG